MNLPPGPPAPRLVFIANTMYSSILSGGDIHTLKLAAEAVAAGCHVHFFAGTAMNAELSQQKLQVGVTLTDSQMMTRRNFSSLAGQLHLFANNFGRFWRTLRQLGRVKASDLVYSNTEFWWDSLPAMLSRARSKMMILHMQAPSLREVIFRTRPDVDLARLASLHFWLSQTLSLLLFRFCRHKRLLYVHPDMRDRLLRRGYKPEELKYISFGTDVDEAARARQQPKRYDVVWIGRVHRQKGIQDLLATLSYLAGRIDGFRTVLIGNLKSELEAEVNRLGLNENVHFAGRVSDSEKFRLFHESRVFLLPSRFEGSPRVLAEALVCQLPVVAYEVETYRAIFGDLPKYVPCFDLDAFQREAERLVREMRSGVNYLEGKDLAGFRRTHSWRAAGETFCRAAQELEPGISRERI